MATLSPEDIKNVETLIKIYAENTENLTEKLKQMYRDSIKSKTRKDFITTCFNTYALFKDTEKCKSCLNKWVKACFLLLICYRHIKTLWNGLVQIQVNHFNEQIYLCIKLR